MTGAVIDAFNLLPLTGPHLKEFIYQLQFQHDGRAYFLDGRKRHCAAGNGKSGIASAPATAAQKICNITTPVRRNGNYARAVTIQIDPGSGTDSPRT